MFTLKLLRDNQKTVVSCARYDVTTDTLDDMTSRHRVITYPKITSDATGVEFWIDETIQGAFRVCFIENETGKTIDRLSVTL